MLLLATVAAVLAASPAAPPPKTSAERAEVAAIGPTHAAEHRRLRADIARYERLSPRQRTQLLAQNRAAQLHLRRFANPAEEGEWSAPFALPTFAIHAALLPTGKVLMSGWPLDPLHYGYDPVNRGDASVWDISKGTGHDAFRNVDPPQYDVNGTGLRVAPIYCSGMTWLGNGDVVVVGGNRNLGHQEGTNFVYTFDPFSETWHTQGEMARGRWYPTATELPDGRAAIMAGWTEAGNTDANTDFEVFPALSAQAPQPGSASRIAENQPVGRIPTLDRRTDLYPQVRLLRSGRLALLGPNTKDTAIESASWPAGVNWNPLPNLPVTDSGKADRPGGNAVLMPITSQGRDRVLEIGGFPYGGTGNALAAKRVDAIEPEAPNAAWQAIGSQSVGRSMANTVLLPDGSLVSVGGAAGHRYFDAANQYGEVADRWAGDDDATRLALRRVELYNPTTNQWTVGPAQQYQRTYHSVALLLPDGSVMSAGDDLHEAAVRPDNTWIGNAEIYKPPYFFRGDRPALTAAPAATRWDQDFDVQSADAATITKAVLMMPSVTTHANDMTQRSIELPIVSRTAASLRLHSPANGNIAPPGYYMVFLLRDGVPSKALFMRIGPDGGPEPDQIGNQSAPFDTQAPTIPANLQGKAAPERIDLTWDASQDASGVSSYNIRRNGVVIGQSATTGFSLTGPLVTQLARYTVSARDAAGNESGESAPLDLAARSRKATLALKVSQVGSYSILVRATASTSVHVRLYAEASGVLVTNTRTVALAAGTSARVRLLLTRRGRTFVAARRAGGLRANAIGLIASMWSIIRR